MHQLFSGILSLSGSSDRRHSIHKLCTKQHVCIVEHAVLERDQNELGAFKVIFQHAANILRVAQIKSGIHLIKNVERRQLEEQKRQNQ